MSFTLHGVPAGYVARRESQVVAALVVRVYRLFGSLRAAGLRGPLGCLVGTAGRVLGRTCSAQVPSDLSNGFAAVSEVRGSGEGGDGRDGRCSAGQGEGGAGGAWRECEGGSGGGRDGSKGTVTPPECAATLQQDEGQEEIGGGSTGRQCSDR